MISLTQKQLSDAKQEALLKAYEHWKEGYDVVMVETPQGRLFFQTKKEHFKVTVKLVTEVKLKD